MSFPLYPHREILRGDPPRPLVEVRVGGAHGYAYLEPDAHAVLLARAKTALGYRQAVLRAAVLFSSHTLDSGDQTQP